MRPKVCAPAMMLLLVAWLPAQERWSVNREGDALDPAISPIYSPYRWPNTPPADLPHARSRTITGIRFTGRYANYTGADTFYPTWARDGHQYSVWTDGYLWTRRAMEPVECRYCDRAWKTLGLAPEWGEGALKPYHCHSNVPPTSTGTARIEGSSPLNLGIVPLGKMFSGDSLYPCISAIADGVFYVGSYSAFDKGGRFNGFRWSRDWNHWEEKLEPGWKSEHWTDTRQPETDFFARDGDPRRFNVLHAVAFGRDNELSPDGKLYFTAHGEIPGGMSNWDKGDAIYLCRVASDPKAVSDPGRYEFFAGRDEAGRARWSNDVRDAAPILEWKGHLGSENITYVPGLRKYILTVARLKEREQNLDHDLLTFWEADEITGPYRLVHYLRDWGPQAYFPNLPSRFVSTDGRTLWLCVSCNYSAKKQEPFGCRYAASFHEIVLDVAGEREWEGPPAPGRNLAPAAAVSVSSAAAGSSPGAVNDERLFRAGEEAISWASEQKTDAWVQLTWEEPVTIERICLYDRPDTENWIHGGTLRFSDGSTERVRAWLSNRALAPTEVTFSPRAVRWVRFEIEIAEGEQPGLLEFEAFAPAAAPREIHVAPDGADDGDGSRARPLRTISAAAQRAHPGDTVTVHEGVYRERVDPARSGTASHPITYRAAPGERVVIKGSEIVEGWERHEGAVWMTRVPASVFGDFNPFADLISGDWFLDHGRAQHTGALYLDGRSYYEATSLADVLRPKAEVMGKYAPSPSGYLFNVAWLELGTVEGARERIPAASFSDHRGVGKAACSEGGECIGYLEHGEWALYERAVNPGTQPELVLRVATAARGGRIEVRGDGPDGDLLGVVTVPPTRGWQKWATVKGRLSGSRSYERLCLVFRGPAAAAADEFALYFAEVAEDHTRIYARFDGLDPNEHLTEINVRRTVFYPSRPGIDHLVVRGFLMEHAATPWAPPTAEQIGLLGTHWSKGWVIEDNVIRHSACVGVTLGKYGDAHDNTSQNRATGYVETIERALKNGWSKERVGGHVVRGNAISDCEQAGIVGSLGGAFSLIEGNHIHRIHVRRLFGGAEMAGIKLHAPIDTVIRNNWIHDTARGIWLDWMSQGTRVTGNILHGNTAQGDLYTEVNHGPTLIDSNYLLSPLSLEIRSQGGAYVHNFIAGQVTVAHREDRKTPYHPAHSTSMAGLAPLASGDDRFVNNIFVRGGLEACDASTGPVFAAGNLYLMGARPPRQEATPHRSEAGAFWGFSVREGKLMAQMKLPAGVRGRDRPLVTTSLLGVARVPGLPFIDPQGRSLRLDTDLGGRPRPASDPAPGPLELRAGERVEVQLWPPAR